MEEEANLRDAYLVGANFRDAQLCSATLTDANLSNADFQGADLHGADLTGAELNGARMAGANLSAAQLGKTDLKDADLWNVDLSEVDLTSTKNLFFKQLAGCNLKGAILPEQIAAFESLATVEELSKNSAKVFISMLLTVAYSLLTIATTKDLPLVTNSISSKLPIIQTEVPIVGFYVATPLLLLGLFVYFHVYLQRLWEALAQLPAIFPDGTRLDERTYPWLMNDLVRGYLPKLRIDKPPLSSLQRIVSTLLGWWLIPCTLFLFWAKYLRRHDWPITILHVFILALTIALGFTFARLTSATLGGRSGELARWRRPWMKLDAYLSGLIGIGVALAAFGLSKSAINGVRHDLFTSMTITTITPSGTMPPVKVNLGPDIDHQPTAFQHRVPLVLGFMGCSPFIDLSELDVSTKPATWTGSKEHNNDDIAQVKGASLRGRNLQYMKAFRAFLVKADLHASNLRGAALLQADLRGADLFAANLEGADLTWARLQDPGIDEPIPLSQDSRNDDQKYHRTVLTSANLARVRLNGVNLDGFSFYVTSLEAANLGSANLPKAYFSNGRLRGADLSFANCERARFPVADLKEATLTLTNLRNADLTSADLTGARFNNTIFENADLSYATLTGDDIHDCNCRGARFRSATLKRVLFDGMVLDEADFENADLEGASFKKADLRRVKHLTRAQVEGAIVDNTTQLPGDL